MLGLLEGVLQPQHALYSQQRLLLVRAVHLFLLGRHGGDRGKGGEGRPLPEVSQWMDSRKVRVKVGKRIKERSSSASTLRYSNYLTYNS